jgi:DNA polymerase-4
MDQWDDGGGLRWLFLDLNAYFASVEQQENPRLRGQPVIVVPAASEYTCAIAASYEAKRAGIRTGEPVKEARRLCPGLHVIDARPEVYVDYHHRILDEIDRHLPVHKVCSIDEAVCELAGPERLEANATALARRVQRESGRTWASAWAPRWAWRPASCSPSSPAPCRSRTA